jgi:hypothetical protein
MGLSLQQFYETLETVGVSAATGVGMDLLFEAIDRAAQTYQEEYVPALEARRAEAQAARAAANPDREAHTKKFVSDAERDRAAAAATAAAAAASGAGGGGGSVAGAGRIPLAAGGTVTREGAGGNDDGDDDAEAGGSGPPIVEH